MNPLTTNKERRILKRRGLAGMLAALILFAMLFTTGFGYILFVNQSNNTLSQANAIRQNAQQQESLENLQAKVTLTGGNLVLAVNNTGGVPVTMTSVYIVDGSGKLLSGFLGPGGTNIPASQWPISLLVGQSTFALNENVVLSGYSYVPGTTVTVEIVTSKGNTFGVQYPPPAPIIQTGNVLVLQMVATPPQTLSCANCVTLTVTVSNYATSPVTGVILNPSPPAGSATGTASLTGGACGAPVPSSNIAAYSGSGNAPSIVFTCTYGAQTGAVGGFGSFTASAVGTLNGVGVSSAESLSNSIQIGGSSNVPTQGAFVVNYFFLKYSACTNAPSGSVGTYSYSSPCSTTPASMPPASLNGLSNGNFINSIANNYVAYYVNVTNNFNATLPILEYSYLFMDPGISTEAYSFLVGPATSPQAPYLPNYCSSGGCAGNKLPVLTPYTATAATCAESPPNYNPPPPTTCIDVAPNHTVTLTFAACGYGSSNWVWGGTPYAQQLDNSAGCVTTPPGYNNAVPEGETLAVVLSYVYKNVVYSQVLPFEAQTLTNVRTSSTAISCLPSPVTVNTASTCTASVTDTSPGNPVTPTGTVTFSQAPALGGTFSNGGTCTLSGSGATATCSLTFTPSLGKEGTDTLTASYPGDTSHYASSGQTTLADTQRTTSTTVVCNPASTTTNTPTNCTITVADTSAPIASNPTGTVTLTQAPPGSGTFTPAASCVLSAGSCSVTFTPNNGFTGTVTIGASYPGDTDHTGSSGSTPVMWNPKKVTTLAVSCVPNSFGVGVTSTCTATLSGFTAPVTGETITFSQTGGTGAVTFVSSNCGLSAGGTCSINVKGKTIGPVTIQASYPGDANNLAAFGPTGVTVTAKSPVTLVQQRNICTSALSPMCSRSLSSGVTSGDLIVIAVGTVTGDTACVTVTSISGTQGDTSYTPAPGGSASGSNSQGGTDACAYGAIFYATVTSSGTDTITVNLSNTPDHIIVTAYELNSALTPPTVATNSCGTPSVTCPTSVSTSSSIAVIANSFLVTVGSDCYSSSGTVRNIVAPAPTNFVTDYGTGHAEYVGHWLPPSSAGSTSFTMTSNGSGGSSPICWGIIGAQFVDPPPPPGWNPTPQSATTTIANLPQLASLASVASASPLAVVSIFSLIALLLLGQHRRNRVASDRSDKGSKEQT